MAASTDLIVVGVVGVAAFGAAWWLGNRLEDLYGRVTGGVRDVVEGGVQAVQDFTTGATGDVQKDRPEPSPGELVLVPSEGVNYQLRKVSDSYAITGAYYRPAPGVKVNTSAPFPSPAPATVYITKPDPQGSYNFPRVSVAAEAGINFREGIQAGLPFAAKYGPLPGLQYAPQAIEGIRTIWGWLNG